MKSLIFAALVLMISLIGSPAARAEGADPFQRYFQVEVQKHPRLGFDVREWAKKIVAGDDEPAGHLWLAIQSQIPLRFAIPAQAAQVHTLWRLGLPQTFLHQWLSDLSDPAFASSTAEAALEKSLEQTSFEDWLLTHPVTLLPREEALIERMPRAKGPFTTLKAWIAQRDAKRAEKAIRDLPRESHLRLPLVRALLADRAARGDLKGANLVLENELEPAIEARHDLEELAFKEVASARLAYQGGQLRLARELYEKVPNVSSLYLIAREELAWVLLRLGDSAALRGDVTALTSPVFEDRFAPESYVVRGISNLKFCFYDRLEKDLADFTRVNGRWAKRIDAALADGAAVTAPPILDAFSARAGLEKSGLAAEVARLNELARVSVTAVLPAVGSQKHWLKCARQASAWREDAERREAAEFRRQWRNQRLELEEAIRKMRFVKVEYLSEIRSLARGSVDDTRVASNGPVAVKADENAVVFPADLADPWPDELFKLRSTAQSKCLSRGGLK